MKDKFEKIESGIASAFMKLATHLPLDQALQLDKLRELIIKECNTLHQQALKDILNKISNSPRNIDLQITLKEIAKEQNIKL